MGYNYIYVPFTAAMALFNIVVLFLVSKRQIEFTRIAYLFFTALLLSAIPPLVFSLNYGVLFLTTLAIMLMIISKNTGNQSSIVYTLIVLTIAIFYHLANWILGTIPAIFSTPAPLDIYVFYKATLASAFMLASLIFVNNTLKNVHISLSKKWFNRSNTRKVIKGVTLLMIYLSFFLVYDFLLSYFLPNDESRMMIWFSANCLFFLITIPVLAGQNSSFLPNILTLGIISLLIYPTIIHLNVLSIRNNSFETGSSWLPDFLFHYFIIVLVIALLFVFYHHVKRISGSRKVYIKTYWVYFIIMAFFLILSEFDHIMVIIGDRNKIGIDETISFTHRIPYSIFFIAASIIILILGFIKKFRFLRIFSLVILSMTIVKIMLFDIVSLTNKEKTILLLILGVIFLIISYFYNVIKNNLLDKTHSHSHSAKHKDMGDGEVLK